MKKRKARGTRGNVYVVTSAGAQYVEDNLDAADEISLNGNDPANELQPRRECVASTLTRLSDVIPPQTSRRTAAFLIGGKIPPYKTEIWSLWAAIAYWSSRGVVPERYLPRR